MYYISTANMLGISAALLGGIVTAAFIRKRRLDKQSNQNKSISFFVINEIFANIIESRSVLEISANDDNGENLICSGLCLSANDTSITVVTNNDNLSKNDINKKIHAFTTFIKNDKRYFYDFHTSIDKICKKCNHLYIDLYKPELISNNQRRRFVRLEPSPAAFRSLQLWLMHTEEKPESGDLLPRHFSLRAVTPKTLLVRNISASGLLLSVQDSPSALAEMLRTQFLVTRLVLGPEAQVDTPLIELRIVSRVRRIAQTGPDTLSFGMEFLRWFQPNPDAAQSLWQVVSPEEGIPPLATLIMTMERIARQKQLALAPLETLPPVLGKR